VKRLLISVVGVIALAGPVAAGSLEIEVVPPQEEAVSPEALNPSRCHQRRIVWSGGIAFRGPRRLRPRPVSSKWETRAQNPRSCPGPASAVLRRYRVSDHPNLR